MYPLRGATRCRRHGGKNQLAAAGSRERGGHPVVHGLYTKYLKAQFVDDAAAASLGTLDEEIRLAKALLAGAVRKHQAHPDGGVIVGSGANQRVRLWLDVAGEFIDRVGKLELRRRQLLGDGTDPGDGDSLKDYRTWLASAAASAKPAASPSSSASAAPSSSPASPESSPSDAAETAKATKP